MQSRVSIQGNGEGKGHWIIIEDIGTDKDFQFETIEYPVTYDELKQLYILLKKKFGNEVEVEQVFKNN